MRTWLYERLATDPALRPAFGEFEAEVRQRVFPRRAAETANIPKPFLIYGLGNDTNEMLAEAQDHVAHRQFFTVWIHDEGPSYTLIDDTIPLIKNRLVNQVDPASGVMGVHFLETSQEFNNETYNTIFRYIRFQAIIGKSGA